MKMKRATILAVTLLSCCMLTAQVTVYRATDKKNAEYAKINDGQWRIDPDGLSTFEGPDFNMPNKPCKVFFVILGVTSHPAPGTIGQVQDMPIGYVGEYTPQFGLGHWSIHGPPGTPNATLQQAITAYVIAQQAASVNATYTGRSPSQCKTPAAPNLANRAVKRTAKASLGADAR
jgi:hypothetical protein